MPRRAPAYGTADVDMAGGVVDPNSSKTNSALAPSPSQSVETTPLERGFTAADTPIVACYGSFTGSIKSRLRRQIGTHPPPRHVGIILDGNRRYARKHGLADPGVAYDLGADKLDDVLAWCSDLGIPAVTLWVCSIDNLKRQEGEVSAILPAVKPKIGALAKDPVIHRRRVRVKAVGRLDLLPPTLVTVLREAERATADWTSPKLTIAIALRRSRGDRPRGSRPGAPENAMRS